jgi:divalent metal cation (Fe/Co/Zn/Cd) transporter
VRDVVERVGGVVAVDWVRARPMGGRAIGEVGVRVSRTLPLDRVTAIKAAIDAAIRRELPDAEFTVTANPVPLDDETILERVMLIAAHQRVPVHHVTVQEIEGRLSVSFDVEVDGRIPLSAAHTLASRLEAAIQDELGPAVEVESHIEPLEMNHLQGREADARTAAAVGLALAEAASGIDRLADVHGVRVRETPSGLVVNYHCRAAPDLDVATVHACVDELERRVRTLHPEILRVIGHAEPAGRG